MNNLQESACSLRQQESHKRVSSKESQLLALRSGTGWGTVSAKDRHCLRSGRATTFLIINFSCAVFTINADPPPGTVLWDFPPSSLEQMKLILESETELTSGSKNILPCSPLASSAFHRGKNMDDFQAGQSYWWGVFLRWVWATWIIAKFIRSLRHRPVLSC